MIRQTITILLAALLLAGCSSGEKAKPGERQGFAREIPAEAQLVATGRPPLSFLFPRGGGKVYLYDQTADSLLFTADLTSGDTNSGLLILDADRKAFVGRDVNNDPEDDVVLLKPIDNNHRYAIYFHRPALKAETEDDDAHADHGHKQEAVPTPEGPAHK